MESVLSEIDEAAEPGTRLSVLAKPQFAAKLKKQVSILLEVVLLRLLTTVILLSVNNVAIEQYYSLSFIVATTY
jgi:hypothetical protein